MASRQQLDASGAGTLLSGLQPEIDALRSKASKKQTSVAHGAPGAKSILLTGASGFLGIHVLAELARRQFDRIAVVVRDASKLRQQAERYQVSIPDLRRVNVIEGDLTSLEVDQLPDVDVVLHGAAAIHCLSPLGRLWRDNVETTLRLCHRYAGTKSRFVFVSSLSVFVSSCLTGTHAARTLPVTDGYRLIGGYAQSKFLGEKLVEAMGGDVIRPGLLTGSSFYGRFPDRDFFTLFLRTVQALGVYPGDYREAFVDVTPVDFAATQVAAFLEQGSGICHIANPHSVALSEMLKLYPLQPVSKDSFEKALATLPRLTQMLMTYAFFKDEALLKYPHYFNVDLFQSTGHQYSVARPFAMSNEALLTRYNKTFSEF